MAGRSLKRDVPVASLAALVSLLLAAKGVAALLEPGYPPSWGGDSYGHLFKIYKLWRDGWRPWIEEWYSGFPLLRFYPPLAYLYAWLLAELTGSPVLAYKLVVVSSPALAALSMYALTRFLGLDRSAAIVASVFFSVNPWFYRIVAPEGNFPRVFGYSLAPLAVLAVVAGVTRTSLRPREAFPPAATGGLLLAAVILSHHTVAAVSLAAGLAIIVGFIADRRPASIRGVIFYYALLALVAFGVASFWLIPFIHDIGLASFTSETSGYLFRFQSARPRLIAVRDPGGWGYFQGWVRLALLAASPFLAIAWRGRRRGLCLSLSFFAALTLLLSLGPYGPAPWLNRLPLIRLIPPYRWLDGFQLAVSILAGLWFTVLAGFLNKHGWGRFWVVALLLLLVGAAWVESLHQLSFWKAESFDRDLASVMMYIGNDRTCGWRFYQWGLGVTRGSMVAWSPVIAGKPSLDGWYRQGDPLYVMHGELGYALSHDASYAEKLLKIFGVRYVVVDTRLRGAARVIDILEGIGFREVYSSGSLRLYRWEKSGLVCLESLGGVLLVSCAPKPVLDLYRSVVRVDTAATCFLDDLDEDTLERYRAIILYRYKYTNITSWRTLLEFVRRGGILLVDTFHSPDAEHGLPWINVTSRYVRLQGAYSLSLANSSTVRLRFSYEGGPWVATVYQGSIEAILKLNNSVVVGRVRLGEGYIYLVGLNLFYYQQLFNSTRIQSLLQSLLPRQEACNTSYNLVEWNDGLIVFSYNATCRAMAYIAEAWYPYWKGFIDGEPVRVRRLRAGTIYLVVPSGEHSVVLRFRDPFTWLRYVSAIFTITLVALAVVFCRNGRRRMVVR